MNYLGLIALLLSFVVGAQTDVDPFSLDIDDLKQLKISVASARPEALLDAPLIVSRIDANQARELGARTLGDWLSLLPGVIVQDSAIGVETVMMRGLVEGFNQKVLFLLDGVPYWQPTHGDFPLAAIALSSISHVEVIRGPGAVLYGSNASAGVINVVTRRDSGAEGLLQLGLHDQHRAEWSQRWTLGKGQLAFALAHADDANYDGEFTERPLPPAFPQDTARSGEIPRDKRMNSVWAHFFSDNTDVHYHAFESESLGLAAAATTLNRSTLRYHGQQLSAQQQWQAWRFYGDATQYTLHIPTDKIFLGVNDGEQQFADDGRDNTRLRIGAQWQWQSNNDTWWLAGVERERRRSAEYQLRRTDDSLAAVQMPPDQIVEQALYAQWDRQWQAWRAVVGWRYVDNEQFGREWLPRLSVNYSASEQQTWRLVHSQGYNAPLFLQLNVRIPPNVLLGNSELNAEKVHNTELAWNYQWLQQHFGVSYFQYELQDPILRSLIANTATVTYTNAEDIQRQGAEVEWQWQHENWHSHITYAWLKDGNSDRDAFSRISPEHIFNIGLVWRVSALQVSLRWQHISTRAAADVTNAVTVQCRYHVGDTDFSIRLRNVLADDMQTADVQDLAAQRLVPTGDPRRQLDIEWRYVF